MPPPLVWNESHLMVPTFRALLSDRSGVPSIEYALLVTGVAPAIITSVHLLGDEVASLDDDIAGSFDNEPSVEQPLGTAVGLTAAEAAIPMTVKNWALSEFI